MPAKSKNEKLSLFVELLQNGHPVSGFSHPLSKRKALLLSSEKTHFFSIPFYPFPSKMKVFDVKKGHAFLHVEDHSWDGFVISSGNFIEVSKYSPAETSYQLRKGDYGSLALKDLRLLFRVGFAHKKISRSSIKFKKSSPSLISLWFGDSLDIKVLFLGTILSALVIAGFISWLTFFNFSNPPNKISDLSPSYLTPFVSKEHIKRAPEALQENIDQLNYLSSIVNYYHALVSMLAGFPEFEEYYLFPPSVDLYDDFFRKYENKKSFALEAQKAADESLSSKQGTAVIMIPAVIGESFEGSALRVMDKISLLHKSLDLSLQLRKEISNSFPKDPEYNYGDYKDFSSIEKSQAYLSKIKPWEPTDLEYTMSKELGLLGLKSSLARKKLFKGIEKSRLLTQDNFPKSVNLSAGSKFASFLNYSGTILSDQKIDGLQGSKFGDSDNKKIVEPLIGEIEPHLIEKTIQKYRYELQLCFELALRRNQSLKGEMEWRWRIDSRGNISDIDLISSTIKDSKMIHCVQEKIATWRFPRPRRGSVEITYPFEFKAVKG